MRHRQITRQEGEILHSKPDGTISQSMDKLIAYKQIKGRKDNALAVVAVEKGAGVFEVVTVMTNFEVQK